MKQLFLLLTILTSLNFIGLAGNYNNPNLSNVFLNDTSADSLNLKELARSFAPHQLNLTNSIIENIQLNKFMFATDKQIIKSNADYEYFVVMVILKQYEFQLSKYHQGFDLFSMKAGNAEFFVNSFLELSHQPEGTKWLNSSYVLEYINSSEKLKSEIDIMEIVNRINSQSK